MNGEKIQNIDTTKTIVLECNNKDSIKTQSVGVGSRRLTALDNAIWTNNFQSIPIKKGDLLTMEYAIINQVGGGQADTMEFNVDKELDTKRPYNDNSVVFETEFYLNHNAINSLGMPYTDTANNVISTIVPYTPPTPPVPPALPDYSVTLHYGQLQRYTKMNGFDPFEDIGIKPATFKRYIQFKIEDPFLTPDTLANKLNLKFHNTNVNLQRQPTDPRASVEPSNTTPDATRYPINFNKDIVVSTPANGIKTTGGVETAVSNPYEVAMYWEQFFVKDPDRWIGGTNLNYCFTNYLEGDTDLFLPSAPSPQLHPRLISRWSLNGAGMINQMPHQTTPAVPPNVANNSAIYEEYMPIFTSIEYSGDNMEKLDIFLKKSHLYYGNIPNEEKALKIDQQNYTTWCDLGRSKDNYTDIAQPLLPFGVNTTTLLNQTCPTIDGQNTGEAGAGISCVGVNPFWINDYITKTKTIITNDQNDTFFFDGDRINLVIASDLPAQTKEARRRNIGAYPYYYTFTDNTTALLTYFLVSKQGQVRSEKRDMRRTCSPAFFGFSPSAYDNHFIQPMNPDIYSYFRKDDWKNEEARVNMNFINVGAFDVNIQYDLALSRFGMFNLHTDRKFGIRDDYAISQLQGESIVKINEPIWLGVANAEQFNGQTQANFGRRAPNYLNTAIANTPLAPAGLEPNPVPFPTINFSQLWSGRDEGQEPLDRVVVEMNQSISDSVCGVFISNVYFGGKGFIADQYSSDQLYSDPALLNKITTRATADNWYGSLLWKMGALYEDFYPQFQQGCRSLRFNDVYYRNKNLRIKNVAPLTTNAQMDTSIIQSLNQVAVGTTSLLGSITAPPVINVGFSNYQLGFDNGRESVLTGVDSRGMFFSGSIHRAETGFYRVYTNFASPEYLTAEGGDLNVIGLALKSYNSADFYYSYSPSYSITADKDFVLTNITTELRDSDGNIANVGDRCVVVYKITKSKEIPMLEKIHKSAQEEGLDKIEEELEELNYNTKMANIIAEGESSSIASLESGASRGGFGASMGGGRTSTGLGLPFGGRASGGRALGGLGIDPVAPQTGIPESAVGGYEARLLDSQSQGGASASKQPEGEPLRRDGYTLSILDARREEERRAFEFAESMSMNPDRPIRPQDLTAGDDIGRFLDNVMIAGIETALNRTTLPVNIDGDIERGRYIDRLLARVIRESNSSITTALNRIRPQLNADMTDEDLQRVAEELANDINGIEVNREGRVLLGQPIVPRATIGDANSRNFTIELTDNGLQLILNILDNPSAEGGDMIEAVGNLLGDGNIQIQREGTSVLMDTGGKIPSQEIKQARRGNLPRRVRGLIQEAEEEDPDDPIRRINVKISAILDSGSDNADAEAQLRDLQQALKYMGGKTYKRSEGGRMTANERRNRQEDAEELFNKTRIKLDPNNPNFIKDLKQIKFYLAKGDRRGAIRIAREFGDGGEASGDGGEASASKQSQPATKQSEPASKTATLPPPPTPPPKPDEPATDSGGGGGRV